MLIADAPSLPDGLAGALRTASARSGAPFEYLLRTAVRESGLDPSVRARTSSATGLFQFIEQTWLELVKEEGPRLGLAPEAAMIGKTARGTFRVKDAEARHHILALREDPAIASMMAGEFTRRNSAYLTAQLGRLPTQGELYIAHFLGADGASRLIRHAANTPDATAADLFPAQAAANRSIFFTGGRSRSVAEVYAGLVSKHGDAPLQMPAAATPTMMAYAPAAATAWPNSAAEAIRSRFFSVEADEEERPAPHRQAEVALPSRFALAVLQMEAGETDVSAEMETISRLRPIPGTPWSDQGPIEPGQLAPIAGRFAPR
jgi:hypothetical protein